MTFDIITIFPGFFTSVFEHGVFKRARAGGQLDIRVHDLRDYTDDRHRTVDDRPFGGGPGMVLKPDPLFRAVEALTPSAGASTDAFPVVLLSPQGRLFRQEVAEELAGRNRVALICGRYEGVDERVAGALATDEISIGDYVLAGGELAAAVVIESVARLLPGVLGNEESPRHESFSLTSAPHADFKAETAVAPAKAPAAGRGLLDFPQYTRPPEYRGLKVPEVLLSGNHEEIRRWRRREALAKTWRRRPELLQQATLNQDDLEVLQGLQRGESVDQDAG